MAISTPDDSFPSQTTKSQLETEEVLKSHRPTADSTVKPCLQRNNHLRFLIRNLSQGFGSRYVSQDASQPWLMYWTLQAFSIMQVGIDPNNKRRSIDRILACQHPRGGFGGGPGQEPHLLPTYAAVCALAIVGGPGEKGGWDQIDRKKMYNFFMSLKQSDGSFTVSNTGEVDVRGIYCLLAVATLLNLLTPELVEGTSSFISSCQTYEGGFSSASFPYYTSQPESPSALLSSPRPSLGEAHGGYTFCAVASWVLLQPFSASQRTPSTISTRNLTRWLVQMQGSELDLGGFRGRSNKLVDGCYAWWVGGCFNLLSGLDGAAGTHGLHDVHEAVVHEEKTGDDEWMDEDHDPDLWNAAALQEYILYAGQHPAGGLRDKPPKNADSYHTLYCLSGLSAAQHRIAPDLGHQKALEALWQADAGKELLLDGDKEKTVVPDDTRRDVYSRALSWNEDLSIKRELIGGAENRLNATHPLFNLTVTHTEGIMAYFYGQPAPPSRARTASK